MAMIVRVCLCAALFGAFQQPPLAHPQPEKPAPQPPPAKPASPAPAPPAAPGKQGAAPTPAPPTEPAPTNPALPTPTRPLVQMLPDAEVKGVSADPNPYLPGQVVTFSWPAGASRVVISGGDLKTPVTLRNQSYFTLATPAPVVPKLVAATQKPSRFSKKAVAVKSAKGARPAASPEKLPPSATAAPLPKPAQYIFDLWYPETEKPKTSEPSVPPPDKATEPPNTPQPNSPPKESETPAKPDTAQKPEPKPAAKKADADQKADAPPAAKERHERYKLTIAAQKGEFPKFTTYRDKYPWRLDYVAGWKTFPVLNLEGGHTLVYLEPREDSPIRMAIASWPVGEMPTARMMQVTMQEGVSQYDVLEGVQQKQTTQAGEAATWLTFQGVDSALPGIKTYSIVLTLVHKGRGFVVSARTPVSKRGDMEILLARLVRSFAFAPASPPVVAPAPKPKTGKVRRTRRTR